MARVQTAVRPSPLIIPSTLKCPECGSADVGKARRFPASEKVGPTLVCPYCAAIAVEEGAKLRMLRTREWAPIVLEPFGFELLEHRLALAKKLGLS